MQLHIGTMATDRAIAKLDHNMALTRRGSRRVQDEEGRWGRAKVLAGLGVVLVCGLVGYQMGGKPVDVHVSERIDGLE